MLRTLPKRLLSEREEGYMQRSRVDWHIYAVAWVNKMLTSLHL